VSPGPCFCSCDAACGARPHPGCSHTCIDPCCGRFVRCRPLSPPAPRPSVATSPRCVWQTHRSPPRPRTRSLASLSGRSVPALLSLIVSSARRGRHAAPLAAHSAPCRALLATSRAGHSRNQRPLPGHAAAASVSPRSPAHAPLFCRHPAPLSPLRVTGRQRAQGASRRPRRPKPPTRRQLRRLPSRTRRRPSRTRSTRRPPSRTRMAPPLSRAPQRRVWPPPEGHSRWRVHSRPATCRSQQRARLHAPLCGVRAASRCWQRRKRRRQQRTGAFASASASVGRTYRILAPAGPGTAAPATSALQLVQCRIMSAAAHRTTCDDAYTYAFDGCRGASMVRLPFTVCTRV